MYFKCRKSLSVPLLCVELTVAAVLAKDYYAITHPAYNGLMLNGTAISRRIIFNRAIYSEGLPPELDRSVLDSRCRRSCHLRFAPVCKAFQTYWGPGYNLLWCDIFNATFCTACTELRFVPPENNTKDPRVWEVKRANVPDPTVPCAEYPDWKVPGNCSACGKIGYYGRNCSLRSSCASYFHESGALEDLTVSRIAMIAPCFTQGQNVSTVCRGPYTFWFRNAVPPAGWWTNTKLAKGDLVNQLPSELIKAKRLLGSTGRNLLFVLYTAGRYVGLTAYSNFSIGFNGSLSLGSAIGGNYNDGFQFPVSKAPLLQPLEPSCGPMWLITGTPYNQTHTDTCAAYTALFGSPPKWAGRNHSDLWAFVNLDYFICN